jgi:hypothetical protein
MSLSTDSCIRPLIWRELRATEVDDAPTTGSFSSVGSGGIARRYCADLCDSPDDLLDGLVDATTHPQIQIYPRGVGRQQGPTP